MYYLYDSINGILWNIRNWFTKCAGSLTLLSEDNEDNELDYMHDEIWNL